MNSYFQKVKEYLLELDFSIVSEDESEGVFNISRPVLNFDT